MIYKSTILREPVARIKRCSKVYYEHIPIVSVFKERCREDDILLHTSSCNTVSSVLLIIECEFEYNGENFYINTGKTVDSSKMNKEEMNELYNEWKSNLLKKVDDITKGD